MGQPPNNLLFWLKLAMVFGRAPNSLLYIDLPVGFVIRTCALNMWRLCVTIVTCKHDQGPFHKWVMCTTLKYCENSFFSNFGHNDPITSKFRRYHDNLALMACTKLRHDVIIMFFTLEQLACVEDFAYDPLVIWVQEHVFSIHNMDGVCNNII